MKTIPLDGEHLTIEEVVAAAYAGPHALTIDLLPAAAEKVRRARAAVDQFVAIGCTFMMRMVAEASRPYGVPTYVALNPIMVDGTGMCGACRVSVAGSTRFACVDGPMFDAHAVDWDELFSRRAAYAREEIEALPQGANPQGSEELRHAKGGHACAH